MAASTTTFDVIVLSNTDVQIVNGINAQHPRGPMMIPCCYALNDGSGMCSSASLLAEDLLNNAKYIEWKNALELAAPMDTRPRITVQHETL